MALLWIIFYYASPLLLGVVLYALYYSTRQKGFAWRAVKYSIILSVLSFLIFAGYVFYQMEKSGSEMAGLAIIYIPIIGFPLAIAVFGAVWALAILIFRVKYKDKLSRRLVVLAVIVILALVGIIKSLWYGEIAKKPLPEEIQSTTLP